MLITQRESVRPKYARYHTVAGVWLMGGGAQMQSPSTHPLQATLGATGRQVFRLGLAASYRPGERAVRRALDEGVNYLFAFGVDTHMNRVIRTLTADQREKVVVATGGYNWLLWHPPLRKSLENALRRLH